MYHFTRKRAYLFEVILQDKFYWLSGRIPDTQFELTHHQPFLWTLDSENKQAVANGSLKFIPSYVLLWTKLK